MEPIFEVCTEWHHVESWPEGYRVWPQPTLHVTTACHFVHIVLALLAAKGCAGSWFVLVCEQRENMASTGFLRNDL